MSCSDYLYNLVDIIAKYAVKEHYTDNGADCDQLEEIKRTAKDLNDEAVYSHAEEVQKYIMNKSKRRKKMSEEKNLYHALVEIDMPMKENETMEEANGLIDHMHYVNDHKWIPVTERLPKSNQIVLVTEDGEVKLCTYELWYGYGYGFYGSRGKVTAWMPLPKAYEGGTANVD